MFSIQSIQIFIIDDPRYNQMSEIKISLIFCFTFYHTFVQLSYAQSYQWQYNNLHSYKKTQINSLYLIGIKQKQIKGNTISM